MKRSLVILPAALLAAALASISPITGPSAAEASAGHVILAVGDMACDQSDPGYNGGAGTSTNCAEKRVSDLMVGDASGYESVLGLGDYQYYCGDPADYAVSYDPTYGRLNTFIDPIVGNHEYQTGVDPYGTTCPTTNSTAQSYFQYFGARAHQTTAGEYSFDIGSWHFIALNANCSKTNVGGCAATSKQTTWLKNDLAAVDRVAHPCVAAFWHQPLWTGNKTNAKTYLPWWNALYAAHADVVLNGHVHNYQRFAALDPTGSPDPVKGITEYVVGTGGESLASLSSAASPQPVAYAKKFGYLRMSLEPIGWSTEFIDSSGNLRDTSSGTCHSSL